jgi:tetratricopeptide (TPR) repeat protein
LYYNQGLAYANLKDSTNAVLMLTQVLEKQPDNENIYKNLANLFNKIGSRKTALDYIQKGLENCPKSLVLHFQCAQIYASMGKKEFANYWCFKCLEIDATYPPALYYLASYYREKENYRGEFEYLSKAVLTSPSVFGHFRVAKYLERTRKDYQEALKHCVSALLLEPQNQEVAQLKQIILDKIQKEEYKKTPEYQEELRRWRASQKTDSLKNIENPPTEEKPSEEKKEEGEGKN